MWIRHVEIEDFAARLREDERSAATVEKYCREAARFTAWLEGREVNQALALAYKAQLAESRTPAGVNGAVAALNKLCSFLGLEGCRLKAVKQQRRIFRDEARELTENEYRRLLAAARRRGNERLLLVMETVCSTGIRISELAVLYRGVGKAGPGGGGQQGQAADGFPARETANAAAALCPETGDCGRAGFCHPHRQAAGQEQYLVGDEGSVPGGRGGAGESVPA